MHSGNIYSITQSKFNPQLRTPIIYTNELSANIYWLLFPNIYPNHLSHRPTSGHVTAVSVYDVFEKNNVLSDFREQQYQSGTRVSLLFFLKKSSPDSDRNRHLYNPVSHSDTVRSSFFDVSMAQQCVTCLCASDSLWRRVPCGIASPSAGGHTEGD